MIAKRLVFVFVLLVPAILVPQARAAMRIMGIPLEDIDKPSYKYDRFYEQSEEFPDDKEFIGEAYDWSGVGVAWEESGGKYYSRWVTMISPQYFLTATHADPPLGAVTFYENNSRTGPSHSYTIDAMVDNFGDITLGRLTTPIAPEDNIAHYPILDFTYSALSGDQKYNTYEGLTFFASGHGGVHPNSDPVSKPRVGRNQVDDGSDGIKDRDFSPSTTKSMFYSYDADGLGDDECYLYPGDSGGPSFVVFNGKLALVGIHWYINAFPPSSIDSFVPHYIDILGPNNDITDYVAIETVTPLGGDANMDGIVNDIDATILATNWGQYATEPTWTQGNFNADNFVNEIDATILVTNWLQSAETSIPGASTSAVPEPTAVVLLLAGVLFAAVLHFRRP